MEDELGKKTYATVLIAAEALNPQFEGLLYCIVKNPGTACRYIYTDADVALATAQGQNSILIGAKMRSNASYESATKHVLCST